MKHLTLVVLVLSTTLLAASAAPFEEGVQVRYRDPSGRMSLTVSQDIEVVRSEPVLAARDFSFDLALAADGSEGSVTVTIDRAKASYEAHAMKQRLGTRHLTGRSVALSIGDEGRRLEPTESSDTPVIDLGHGVQPGFSIADALADSLPVLPEEAVAVGATWTTTRTIRSLEGWTWTTGRLKSRHRVAAVDREKTHTVVSVETEAEAALGPVEGGPVGSAELERKLRWTFDVTHGRLLSMSMEQESEGVSTVPQGEIRIRQRTRIELGPLAS